MKIREWVIYGGFGLLAFWGLAYWTLTLIAMWHNYLPLPIWDYWMTVMHLEQYESLQFSVVLPQHNEHRVIFPELVWALDYLYFHGQELLPLVLGFAFHFATFVLFAWKFAAIPRLNRKVAAGGVLLCGILMGWRGLSFLLSSPFAFQWTMFEGFSALALWQISRAKNASHPWITLMFASLGAAVAEFSSAQGVGIWPILILAAWWQRLEWRRIAGLAAAGVFFTALFFVGYQKSPTDPGILFHHFVFWARFLGCYLGLPFSLVNIEFGILMGWLSLILMAGLLWRFRRADVRGEPAGVLYAGFAVLNVFTGFLISLGRLDLADAAFDGAKQGRYLLMPVLYWTGLLLSSVWLLSLHRSGERRAGLAIACIAVLLAASLPRAGVSESVMYRRLQEASLSVEAGLEDRRLILDNIYPDIFWPHKLIPLLREQRMSIFAGDRYLWLGQTPSARRENREVPGGVALQKPVDGGWEAVGWISPDFDGRDLVFIDPSGRVVGIGEVPRAGLPIYFRDMVSAQKTGWVGFVNFRYGAATARIWAYNRDHSTLSPVGNLSVGP